MSPRWRMYGVYSLLALGVLLPMLAPGYILTMDMVFVPHPPLPVEVSNSYLFYAALHVLSYVIPSDILQKLVLFSILFLSGIGAHLLVKNLRRTKELPAIHPVATYVAGLLYMFNPFVYGRFMAGQYEVLLGYALLPFFVRALLQFLQAPSFRHVVPALAFTLAMSIVSIHTLGLAALFTIVAAGVVLWHNRRERQYLVAILRHGVVGIGMVLLLSAYWLVPLLLGRGRVAGQISGFGDADRAAFATDGGVWQVLQLQGFWVEAQQLFTPVGDPLPLSGLLQIALWTVIVVGLISMWRRQRQAAVLFGVVALLSIILAIGTPVNIWLTEQLPLFAGYREPQKFVALLALVYAVFVAWGAAAIISRITSWQWRRYGVAVGLLLLPILVTPTMVWGFNSQLTPRQYPSDWYTVNERLNQDTDHFKILFLPWHHYMRFHFSERIIAHPADGFFEKPIIVSHDPEFAGIKPPAPTAAHQVLDSDILPHASQSSTLGSHLAPLGIKYVLLAKDHDYEEYSYLDKQRDLQLVTETGHLKLYRNTMYKAEEQHAGH